jgi:imidazolonepropionase-like amidohydrolase
MHRALLVRVSWVLVVAGAVVAPGVRAQEGPWALTNARIETVTRGVIERGTIVIRNGLIQAVGADVAAPADARVLDLTGRTVYPGIIDLTSSLGIASAPAGGQQGPGGGGGQAAAAAPAAPTFVGLEPDRRVAEELRAQPSDVQTARDGGITAVVSAPSRGAFRGLSAFVPLRDSVTALEIVRSPVGLHMGFQGAQGRYPATLFGVIAYERQAFYDARRQALLLERYRQNPRGMERPTNDARLAALIPVLKGELPVFFAAGNENEIKRALGIGREFGLNLVVTGAGEGFRALDALQAGHRPVVVSVDFPRPADATGWAYRAAQRHALNDSAAADTAARRLLEGNAAALNRAGIRIALASGGSLRPSEFLANVRKAIAAGLPRDTALAALTIRPAEIAGVAQQLGSIEEGKIANLVVTENDLLGDSSKLKMVFVDGIRYEVTAPPPPAAGALAGRGGAAAGAPAQVGGTWDVNITTPQGDQAAVMTVNQSGPSFTGTMTSPMGSLEISGGSIEGSRVSWSIAITMGGQSMIINFEGEVEGTRMRGTAQMGEFGSMQFTGEKRPS